jgi:uncharacterized protein (TIGR00251 family)
VQREICREVTEGLILTIRVTPKSSKNEVAGIYEAANGAAAISVKVSAPPDKGKANQAVIELFAKALKVPKSSLTIVSGETSRSKHLLIRGKPPELRLAVERLVQEAKS